MISSKGVLCSNFFKKSDFEQYLYEIFMCSRKIVIPRAVNTMNVAMSL